MPSYEEEMERRQAERERRDRLSPAEAQEQAKIDEMVNAARLRARREADLFRKILRDPQGRKFLWDLMNDCRVFEPSYGLGGDDSPMAVGFREGQRTVGLQLLAKVMTASMDSYLTMWQENSPDYDHAVAMGVVSRR